jgi:myo-inositol-1(or 4)-monophosphatase
LLTERRRPLSSASSLWVIDPIDGTANFLRGAAPWAISIALIDEVGPAVGVVTIPAWRLQYSAVRGKGALLNGVRLAQRTAVDPREALVGTGLSYRPALRTRWLRALAPTLEHVADIRRSGSAAADLCAVAAGLMDGFIELDLAVWDVAAGLLVASEAGCPVWSLERPGAVDVLAARAGLDVTLLPILEREHARLLRDDRRSRTG